MMIMDDPIFEVANPFPPERVGLARAGGNGFAENGGGVLAPRPRARRPARARAEPVGRPLVDQPQVVNLEVGNVRDDIWDAPIVQMDPFGQEE